MTKPNLSVNVESPSAAISEIAKGMSQLRDALQALSELANRDCPVSALAPHLHKAWEGAAAVSVVCAVVGSMDWAGDTWPGIQPGGSTV